MNDTRLGHYTLRERIGSGGMGVVYRARDERLERDVAIKVLPEHALADDDARARLRREALLLSRLSHPAIATIHDFDRDGGLDFLVMELVSGDTLDRRLASGPLPEGDIVSIGRQIAEALEAAHGQGIVHRDLKPGNVALLSDGRVKVLDFGIAAVVRDPRASDGPREGGARDAGARVVDATAAGATDSLAVALSAAGTLRYMAPEQALGKSPDARSDLYSLGAVLYELATGRPPHDAASATELWFAVVNAEPPRPASLRLDLSPALERLIVRSMEKDPARRPASATEVRRELERVVAAGPVPAAPAASGSIRSLAVLPLADLSGDAAQEFFAEGMTDALIGGLAQLGALRVISRTSAMRYKDTKKTVPEIARELNVDAVVEGTVVRSGDRVRITAQLVDAGDHTRWSRSYQRELADVLDLQSTLAREVAEEIRVTLTPRERERLASARPIDPAAHEAFLRGRFHWNRRTEPELRRSIECFLEAIEREPRWALAYAGLADAYNILATNAVTVHAEAIPRAKAAAVQAIEIDPQLGEAHVSLAYGFQYHDWNWKAAEREFRLGLELSPGYATGHQWFAMMLGAFGKFDEALEEAQTSKRLDPLSPVLSTAVSEVLYLARRYAESNDYLERVLAVDPRFAPALMDLGRGYLQDGRHDLAIQTYRRALEIQGSDPGRSPSLGLALATAGRHDEARAVLERLLAPPRRTPPWAIASIYHALGESEHALDWLEKACEERDRALVWLKVHPRFDSLRGHPRYQALLELMKFPD